MVIKHFSKVSRAKSSGLLTISHSVYLPVHQHVLFCQFSFHCLHWRSSHVHFVWDSSHFSNRKNSIVLELWRKSRLEEKTRSYKYSYMDCCIFMLSHWFSSLEPNWWDFLQRGEKFFLQICFLENASFLKVTNFQTNVTCFQINCLRESTYISSQSERFGISGLWFPVLYFLRSIGSRDRTLLQSLMCYSVNLHSFSVEFRYQKP